MGIFINFYKDGYLFYRNVIVVISNYLYNE